jgi:hypothetical protein
MFFFKRKKLARKTRPIILHYHLFKNAGTTIEYILDCNFQEGHRRIENDVLRYALPNSKIIDLVKSDSTIKAVSSHQARPPLPQSEGITFLPIIFLRHPLDRIESIYLFEKKLPPDTPSWGGKMARKLSFPDYVKWRLDHG